MSNLPDIDKLIELAQSDPAQLEQIRQREIDTFINSAPAHMQQRLRGLQFQIDCKRQLHKHPLGACLAITGMMMDSLQRLNEALQGSEDDKNTGSSYANVLTFPSATGQNSLNVQ